MPHACDTRIANPTESTVLKHCLAMAGQTAGVSSEGVAAVAGVVAYLKDIAGDRRLLRQSTGLLPPGHRTNGQGAAHGTRIAGLALRQ